MCVSVVLYVIYVICVLCQIFVLRDAGNSMWCLCVSRCQCVCCVLCEFVWACVRVSSYMSCYVCVLMRVLVGQVLLFVCMFMCVLLIVCVSLFFVLVCKNVTSNSPVC